MNRLFGGDSRASIDGAHAALPDAVKLLVILSWISGTVGIEATSETATSTRRDLLISVTPGSQSFGSNAKSSTGSDLLRALGFLRRRWFMMFTTKAAHPRFFPKFFWPRRDFSDGARSRRPAPWLKLCSSFDRTSCVRSCKLCARRARMHANAPALKQSAGGDGRGIRRRPRLRQRL
jgi:hypothetical protein